MPASIFTIILIELLFVAWIDIKTKKISNYWILVNLTGFIALVFLQPEIFEFSVRALFMPLVFVLVGYMLFTLNIMGAGDSKYLFSIFLLVPYPMHDLALYTLIYSTVVVGLISSVINLFSNKEKLKKASETKDMALLKSILGKKFTYAPVILLSWLWFGYLGKVWQ